MSRPLSPGAPHRARKRFGQNFLTDPTVIHRISAAVRPRAGQTLVEIGPGQGALTEPLAERAERLHVIELDRDLVPWLRVRFEKHPGFELHQADALKFDFAKLGSPEQPLRVVGNLPYNISTPLIFHLLAHTGCIQDMHFMLQKEVVRRLAAAPGEKAYGRLSVMVQYHCQVSDLFDVPPESFEPAPKVDSAIVRLVPYRQKPITATHMDTLERVVSAVFQKRRKTLRNGLKALLEPHQLDELTLDLTRRAETLSVTEFVELADAVAAFEQSPS